MSFERVGMVPSTTVGKDKQQCESKSVNASERRMEWVDSNGVSESTKKQRTKHHSAVCCSSVAMPPATLEKHAVLIKKQASHS